MLKWLMKRRLRAFGDAFDYDTTYGAELIDADLNAGLSLARLRSRPIGPMRPRPRGLLPRSSRS